MFTNGYKIKFSYVRDNNKAPVTTYCEVIDLLNEEIYVGTASCSKKDFPQKKVGRKVALSRALKTFDRETRKNIWEDYLKKFGV